MERIAKTTILFLVLFVWYDLHFNIYVMSDVVESHRLVNLKPCSPSGELPNAIGSLTISDSERLRLVKKLINEGADVNEKFCYGMTPLLLASSIPRKEFDPILEVLVEKGANVNYKTDQGTTALHNVVIGNRVKSVFILLANGAEVNVRDDEGRTPLHFASSKKIVEVLLQNGASPKLVDIYGNSPIHKMNDESIIRQLLKFGADINAQNLYGKTPLHRVVMNIKRNHSLIKIAKYLIKNGADPSIKDKKGMTPLDYASDTVKLELMEFIDKVQ